jgi:hypothetical protein
MKIIVEINDDDPKLKMIENDAEELGCTLGTYLYIAAVEMAETSKSETEEMSLRRKIGQLTGEAGAN